MSFVLDALKKAQSPQHDTVHTWSQSRPRRVPGIIWLLVVGLLINAAVVIAWQMGLFRTSEELSVETAGSTVQSSTQAPRQVPLSEPPLAPQPSLTSQPGRTTEPGPTPSQKPSNLPRQVATTTSSRLDVREPTATTTRRPATGPKPTALADLSAESQARFPALEYSTHVYTDDAAERAVVINGVRLRQGDLIEGLRLHEITEAGVVFEFESGLIAVSVLEAWNL